MANRSQQIQRSIPAVAVTDSSAVIYLTVATTLWVHTKRKTKLIRVGARRHNYVLAHENLEEWETYIPGQACLFV